MTGFSNEEIQAARALVDAATDGDWLVVADGTLIVPNSVLGQAIGGTEHPADAEFIAAARSLVPRLLDALEQAQAELASWITVLCQQTDKIDDLVSQVGDLQFNHDVMEVRALRAEAAVVEARKAALLEAAGPDCPDYQTLRESILVQVALHKAADEIDSAATKKFTHAEVSAWLRARADALGSTPPPADHQPWCASIDTECDCR